MDWQQQPTGRLMILAFRQFEEQLLRELRARGFKDITLSHLNVMRHLDPAGLNLVQLAEDAGLSKQAISKIIGDLARRAYVSMAPDPADGRAKRVHYQPRGKELVAAAISIVKAIEKTYLDALGDDYHGLRRALNRIYHLHGDQFL